MWIWQRDDWPAFRWDDAALAPALLRARKAQGVLQGKTGFLRGSDRLAALAEVLIADGMDTSAIEGEQLDPESVRSSVARRLGMPEAGLRPPEDRVAGLVDMLLDATERHDRSLTVERLCGWQAALFPTGHSSIHRIRTGELRGDAPMRVVSGPIGRERVHYEAPPRDRLEPELDRFLVWFDEPPEGMDGLLRAALAHLWFETLHPFEDGNGRVGRAVADMAIAQDDGERARADYYQRLESASGGDLDVTPWLAWFLDQITAAIEDAARTIEATLAKARFWMRHRETELNERQRKVLNRLLDAGAGGFGGGMTNRKYKNLTKTSTQTATRDLSDLVDKGCLVVIGAGRSTSYELPDDYGA
jgi:Fic family protein